MIQIKNIFKKYDGADYTSVSDLSIDIRQGEIFGLLGPNGAGKTTLISILCGLLKPTSGEIIINDLSFRQDKKALQLLIGVVPQEYALYPTLTAYENLLYFGAMYGLKGADLKSKINESLEKLGLLKFANKQIKTFSGGMKRRVNLIAGVLHQPEILFLDEPTVGVDVQSKNVIIDYLKLLNEKGTTIIYTSHHMVEAQQFCTRVGIIDSGKMIIEGVPQELIENTSGATRLEDVYIELTGGALRDYV